MKSLHFLTIVAAVILTVATALVHGHYSNRWGQNTTLSSEAEHVMNLPHRIGDWDMTSESSDISDIVRKELAVEGYVSREYEHVASGQRVRLLLMVGPPGPLVRHPPSVCYRSLVKDTVSQSELRIDAYRASHHFKRIHFKSIDESVGDFAVYYGFTADGHWSSPGYPRLAFGGEPALYKLQVLGSESDSTGIEGFLRALVTSFQTATG